MKTIAIILILAALAASFAAGYVSGAKGRRPVLDIQQCDPLIYQTPARSHKVTLIEV